MDPIYNCVLGICCPPGSPEQMDALIKFLVGNGVDADAADTAAKVILAHFDLAPKDTLQPFKDAVAELARGQNYTAD